jgi:hypothetical protein
MSIVFYAAPAGTDRSTRTFTRPARSCSASSQRAADEATTPAAQGPQWSKSPLGTVSEQERRRAPAIRRTEFYGTSGRHDLFGVDVGRADHLGPLLGFADDVLAKIGWRTPHDRTAQVCELRPDPGVGESRVDFPI